MNLDLRYGLILLALYLPAHSVYAATVHKSLAINDLFKPLTFGTHFTSGSSATYTFSGLTANYINYVQLCQATNNTCSSCGAPYATYKMLTSNNGIPYDTVGTTWGIQAATIQNYLTENGYGNGTYYLGLYVQSKDLVCNGNQSYCSTSQDSAHHVLCMRAVSSAGTTTLTQEDNGLAALSSNTTPYLYVNNGSSANTTSVCPAYATPFACTTTNNSGLSPSTPYGIAVDPPSKNIYVISHTNNSLSNSSLSCTIDSTTGGLSCSTLTFASTLSCIAQGIAIDPPGQNAYVTCGNNVYKCALGGSTCNQITLSGSSLNTPTGIVIDPTNSYMAIANAGGSLYLTVCYIDGTGCVTGNTGNAIAYVAVDSTSTYLYTGRSSGGSSVYSCPVSVTSGTLSIGTCSTQTSGATGVKGIALNPSGTNVYIALQSSGGLINSCPTSPGTAINSSCTSTSSTGTSSGMQGAAWGNVVGP